MNVRKILTLVGALMVGLGIFLGLISTASAQSPSSDTKVVSWYTSVKPGVTDPKDANDVNWPQHLVQQSGECELQIDTYKYDNATHRKTVDDLIASGVLNYPGQQGSDSSVYLSASFQPVANCGTTPTPTPTPSSTSPSSTPPTSTTPSTTPPTSTVPSTPTRPVTSKPSTRVPSTHKTTAVVVPVRPAQPRLRRNVVPAPTPTPSGSSTSTTTGLAYTGTSHPIKPELVLGIGIVLLGVALTIFGRVRRTR